MRRPNEIGIWSEKPPASGSPVLGAAAAWTDVSPSSVRKIPLSRILRRAVRRFSALTWPRVFLPADVTPLYA